MVTESAAILLVGCLLRSDVPTLTRMSAGRRRRVKVYSGSMLNEEKQEAFHKFDEAVIDLRRLLRDRESMTDDERLFLENRLMILQLEYNVWAKAQKVYL